MVGQQAAAVSVTSASTCTQERETCRGSEWDGNNIVIDVFMSAKRFWKDNRQRESK